MLVGSPVAQPSTQLSSKYLFSRCAAAQAAMLRDQQRVLVRALRPDAVALVDAFAYEDYQLNSALGRKDGDVYKVDVHENGSSYVHFSILCK